MQISLTQILVPEKKTAHEDQPSMLTEHVLHTAKEP
jgi:hypothetical protein